MHNSSWAQTAPMQPKMEIAVNDPLQQSLWLQLAELNSAFISKASVAREQMLREMTHSIQEPRSQTNSVSDMPAISASIIGFIKELAKCKELRRQPRTVRTVPPKFELAKRFGNSDLVRQN